MRNLLAILLLTCWPAATLAQEWHPVASSFCSQIKAKGAKVSNRPFSIFAVPDQSAKCCDGLNLKLKGKTLDFGYFKVLDLPGGRYFLSFDLKTKQVNIPIFVEHIVDKRYLDKDCETGPGSSITVDKKTEQLKWEEWITVE